MAKVVVVPQTVIDPFLAGWLKCEEETCRTRLAVFSAESIPTAEKAKQKELVTWRWGDDLKCPSGHPIRNPKIML